MRKWCHYSRLAHYPLEKKRFVRISKFEEHLVRRHSQKKSFLVIILYPAYLRKLDYSCRQFRQLKGTLDLSH